MSSTEVVPPREHEELHDHPSPRKYVWVAVILAIITALEVGIYYIPGIDAFLIPGLVVFAVLKFVMVAMYFMHLKFDSKLFRRFFVTGIVLAFIIFTVVLLTFFLRPEAAGITG
ncbi:MAG: cytochrome C oxidase subunit IV family protein [Actinomycetota bacterium]